MYQQSFPKGFNQQFMLPSDGPWFDLRNEVPKGNFMFIIILNGKNGMVSIGMIVW